MQDRNDRLRFEELLKTQPASMNDVASDGYLSKEQEEAEINAMRK
jgi:competence protein ComGC